VPLGQLVLGDGEQQQLLDGVEGQLGGDRAARFARPHRHPALRGVQG
jgi:hypothetical protein